MADPTNDLRELHQAFGEFKTVNDAVLLEIKQYGKANGELVEKVEKLQACMDAKEAAINLRFEAAEKRDAERTSLEAKMEQVMATIGRKSSFSSAKEEAEAGVALRKAVFFKALRSTVDHRAIRQAGILEPEELKSLIVNNDKTGGYLAPPEFIQEMLVNVVEYSNIRSIARVRTTSAGSVQLPKRTQTAAAAWTAEKITRSETQNPAFGLEEVKAHEMTALAKVSHTDLEDSVFDLEGFLRDEFAEQTGLTEGTAFVSGNGIAKPEGFLTNSDVAYVAGGDASTITGDGLIALYFELKEPYLINAYWTMSRSTLKAVRTLKETTTGQYLWAPGIKADARPATILDRPYLTCPDMPTIAGNAYPVAFGDFRRAYTIVDRLQLDVMVDPFTSKSTGMVEFSARRRVGGQVVLAEAIKKLKIATS